MGLGAFASVVASLQRPLTKHARDRFLGLLFIAFLQITAALLPLWLGEMDMAARRIWQVCSAIMLALYLVHLACLVWPLARHAPREELMVINPAVTFLMWGSGVGAYVLLIVNGLELFGEANFRLYYAACFVGLFVGFLVFAELVVGGRETR